MEAPTNSFFKNARNQKRKNDKGKKGPQKGNKTNENVKNPSHQSNIESKPQRTNQRQRTQPEVVDKVNTLTQDKDIEEEDVIDHSHLKRETEEITKLTQKSYGPRQITSTWEKYTLPEVENIPRGEDESDAADFASLLQVPQSYGGHLKLKEEKDWCTKSEAILDSFLAFDLNSLARGLASIPFYQRHELSTDLFSKEELDHMQAVAYQKEKSYKLYLSDSVIRTEEKRKFENSDDDEVEIENKIEQSDSASTKVTSDLGHPILLDNESLKNIPTTIPVSNTSVRVENSCLSDLSLSDLVLGINTVEDNTVSKNLESENQLIASSLSAEVNDKISSSVTRITEMDDDEELDFLLSLKQPIKKIIEPKTVTVESPAFGFGVSNKPESILKTDVASDQGKLNLDDWLDSVLED